MAVYMSLGVSFVDILRQLCQQTQLGEPIYEISDIAGPEEDRLFIHRVKIQGHVFKGMARRSSEEANDSAAEIAWRIIADDSRSTVSVAVGRYSKSLVYARNYLGPLGQYSYALPPKRLCTLNLRPGVAMNLLAQTFGLTLTVSSRTENGVNPTGQWWNNFSLVTNATGEVWAEEVHESTSKPEEDQMDCFLTEFYTKVRKMLCECAENLEPLLIIPTSDLPEPSADRIASRCKALFIALCHNLLHNPQPSEAFAAFIIHDTKADKMEIVSLASGSKCIRSQHLSDKGLAVHDCHAEVLARRAFLRFLYETELKNVLPLSRQGTSPGGMFDWCWHTSGSLLELKKNFKVYLFISKPPCGDATIKPNLTSEVCHGDKEQHWPCWSEGCRKNVYPQKGGSLQKKHHDGFLCGNEAPDDRNILHSVKQPGEALKSNTHDHPAFLLRTMSCSDKLLKWKSIGIQGAAMSKIVQPIFLSNIFIGDNNLFETGHVARAVCCRFTEDLSTPAGHGPVKKHPRLVCAELPTAVRTYPGNTTSFSLNWFKGALAPESIDTDTGMAKPLPTISVSPRPLGNQEYTRSKLCKRELCTLYNEAHSSITHDQLVPARRTYGELKESAREYQQGKRSLYDALTRLNHGEWEKKPAEVDSFEV